MTNLISRSRGGFYRGRRNIFQSRRRYTPLRRRRFLRLKTDVTGRDSLFRVGSTPYGTIGSIEARQGIVLQLLGEFGNDRHQINSVQQLWREPTKRKRERNADMLTVPTLWVAPRSLAGTNQDVCTFVFGIYKNRRVVSVR
jgi:hypothetical protein